MYRWLAIENVRLEDIGLRQETHADRFLRRIVNGPDIAPLAILLRFAEPVTLGQRIHANPTLQTTPLVQIVDAATKSLQASDRPQGSLHLVVVPAVRLLLAP